VCVAHAEMYTPSFCHTRSPLYLCPFQRYDLRFTRVKCGYETVVERGRVELWV
jgi:hypothetical protein